MALVTRWHGAILLVFGALVVLALALAPRLQFDSDPLDTQSPNTEAMRTLRDLMNDPLTNPYSIDILAPNVDQARDAGGPIDSNCPPCRTCSRSTASCRRTRRRNSPWWRTRQDILAPTLLAPAASPPVTPAQIRAAASSALDAIDPALATLPPDSSAGRHRRRSAAACCRAGSNAAGHQHRADPLPARPARSPAHRTQRAAGQPGVNAAGHRARLGAARRTGARAGAAPAGFPHQRGPARIRRTGHAVAPDAGGTAVTIEATSATIIGAFRSAAISAVLAIAVILLVALRRLRDAALVLAPLLLSAALTVLVMVLLPLPLNFANIIALPLLLGVGVSFNIYFVMNWRDGRREMLASATARAVVFSALTTGTSFGSLALSQHPGTASMGELLLISLGCTLVASLVFVPALLAAISQLRGRISTEPLAVPRRH